MRSCGLKWIKIHFNPLGNDHLMKQIKYERQIKKKHIKPLRAMKDFFFMYSRKLLSTEVSKYFFK